MLSHALTIFVCGFLLFLHQFRERAIAPFVDETRRLQLQEISTTEEPDTSDFEKRIDRNLTYLMLPLAFAA